MASISLKIYSAALKTRTNVNVIIPTLLPAQDGMNKREHEFARNTWMLSGVVSASWNLW